MHRYRLVIGNPGAGKSTIANWIAKRILFKSGISYGAGKTCNLDKENHDDIVYLDTPGLADIKMRKIAARAITEALKQNGKYQIFFVIAPSAGRFQPEDLTTIWLVLQNAPDITIINIIINKLSKGEYESFQNKDGMVESILLEPLEMMGMRTECNVFLLLHDQMLADADDAFVHYPKLEKVVKKDSWVDVDSSRVSDIPGDEESFRKQLDSMRDRIITSWENQLSMLVRLLLLFFFLFIFFITFMVKYRKFEIYLDFDFNDSINCSLLPISIFW